MSELRGAVEVNAGPNIYQVPETGEQSQQATGLSLGGRLRFDAVLQNDAKSGLILGGSMGVSNVTGQHDVSNGKISDVYLGTVIPDDPQACPDTTCYTSQNFNRFSLDAAFDVGLRLKQLSLLTDIGVRQSFFSNGHAYLDNDLITPATEGIQHALNGATSLMLRPQVAYAVGPVDFRVGLDTGFGKVSITSPDAAKGSTGMIEILPFAAVSIGWPFKSTRDDVVEVVPDIVESPEPADVKPEIVLPVKPAFSVSVTQIDTDVSQLSRVVIPFTGDVAGLNIKTSVDSAKILGFSLENDVVVLNLSSEIKSEGSYKILISHSQGELELPIYVKPDPNIKTPKPNVDVEGWE